MFWIRATFFFTFVAFLSWGLTDPGSKPPATLKGGPTCPPNSRPPTEPIRALASHVGEAQLEKRILNRLLDEQTKEFACEGEILKSAMQPLSKTRKSIERLMADGLESINALYLELRELENHEATWDLPPEATTFGAVSYKDDPTNPFKTRQEMQAAIGLRQAALEIAFGLLPFGHHPEMNAFLKNALKNQKALRGKTVDARPPFNKNEFLQNLAGQDQRAWSDLLKSLEQSHHLEQAKLTAYLARPQDDKTIELKQRLHKVGFFDPDTWSHLQLPAEEVAALKKMEARLKSEERDSCLTGPALAASFIPKVGDVLSFLSEACEAKENICPVDVPTSFKKGMCAFLGSPEDPNHRPQFYGQARSLKGCSMQGGFSLAAAVVPYGGKLRKLHSRAQNTGDILRMLDALAAERAAASAGKRLDAGVLALREQHRFSDWAWAQNKREAVNGVVERTVGKLSTQESFLSKVPRADEIDMRLTLLNRPGRLGDLEQINRMSLDHQYTKGTDWLRLLAKETDPLEELLPRAIQDHPELGAVLRGTEGALAELKKQMGSYHAALNAFGTNRQPLIRNATVSLTDAYQHLIGAIGETQFALRAGKGFQYNTFLKDHTEKMFSEAQRLAAARDPVIRKRLEDMVSVDMLKFLQRNQLTPENLAKYRLNLVRNKELDAVKFAPDGTPTWIEIKNFSSPLMVGSDAHSHLVQQMNLLTVSAEVWQRLGGKPPKLELVMLGGLSPAAVADLQRRFGTRVQLRY